MRNTMAGAPVSVSHPTSDAWAAAQGNGEWVVCCPFQRSDRKINARCSGKHGRIC